MRSRTVLFALTILVSSSLLFVVQPMVAKMVLPLLGGAPAVWNTCMVFFQACLLVGYAYAHVSTRWLGVRRQAMLHVAIVAAALWLLPLKLPAGAAPPPTANPSLWLLAMLATTIAVPFIVVSATSPLVQKWFAQATGGSDPYFLYAASNIGSIAALLSYPALVEPTMDLSRQSRGWMIGYWLLLALMTTGTAAVVVRRKGESPAEPRGSDDRAFQEPRVPVTWRDRVSWVAFSFVPSSYLLGVTTYITTDIAAVPLLWVVPLTLYLLTFVITFSRRPLLPHGLMVRATPFAAVVVVILMLLGINRPAAFLMSAHLLAFFIAAMMCHGELVRRRPEERHLTEFYLIMSLGGVLGGIFNALVAPRVFLSTAEYPIAIVLGLMLAPLRAKALPARALCARALPARALPASAPPAAPGRRPDLMRAGVRGVFVGILAALLVINARGFAGHPRVLAVRRSFFGIHRLVRADDGRGSDGTAPFNELYHGTTLHGRQYIDPTSHRPIFPREPLTYYHRAGPLGDVMLQILPRRYIDRPLSIAAVGLGTGSVAAYCEPGWRLTVFEIDPLVRWFAEESGGFTFLSDARGRGVQIDTVLGDARLTIQRAADRSFDVLILDAFSGDAIPIHLLTRQAFEIYLRKVRPDGLILVHVSNRYVDLRPVVANLADHFGLGCVGRLDDDAQSLLRHPGKERSVWLVLTPDVQEFAPIATNGRWLQIPRQSGYGLWTDEFSDIVSLLRWRGGGPTTTSKR